MDETAGGTNHKETKMATENTISEALDKAILELDDAAKGVNMVERLFEQMDSFQLEGEALDGFRQILYRVVRASDAVCRLVHPEWLRYRDEAAERAAAVSEAIAEAKDAVRSTSPTDYEYVPGRDC